MLRSNKPIYSGVKYCNKIIWKKESLIISKLEYPLDLFIVSKLRATQGTDNFFNSPFKGRYFTLKAIYIIFSLHCQVFIPRKLKQITGKSVFKKERHYSWNLIKVFTRHVTCTFCQIIIKNALLDTRLGNCEKEMTLVFSFYPWNYMKDFLLKLFIRLLEKNKTLYTWNDERCINMQTLNFLDNFIIWRNITTQM